MEKTERTPGQPIALRRRLLLSVPGGLALTTPLAAAVGSALGLTGCGGGDGGGGDIAGPAPVTPPAGSLRDPGRAFAGTREYVQVEVAVEVPAGVALPEGGLAVYTALGGFGAVSGTRATTRQLTAAPQWATLVTSEGLPLLFGYVGAGSTTLSAHSTATALVAMAMGAEFTGGSANAAWIEELRRSPAITQCGEAIAAALAADPYALARCASSITDAVRAAIVQVLPSMQPAADRTRALGVGINPPNAASGVQPIIGEAVNTVFIQNEKLRRAHYVIRREAHTPSAGTEVPDAARPRIAAGDLPTLPGFDSAGSIIGSVAQAHYANDSTGLAYSRTDAVPTPVSPDGAKRTRYSVTVLTAGNAALGYDPAVYARLTDEEKKMIDITLFAPENLALKQLFIDLLIPLFLSWLGGKIGDEVRGMGPREYKEKIEAAVFGQILSAFQTTLPNIAAKIRDPKNYPNYGVAAAFREIIQSHLVDWVEVPVPAGPGTLQPLKVPVLSKFSISMVLLLVKYLAYEQMKGANGEAILNFLDGNANDQGETIFQWQPSGKDKNGKPLKPVQFNKENLQFAGLGVATKCLQLVDDGLNLLSKTRLLADLLSSRLLESWDVSAVQAKVRLRPNPFEVDTSGIYAATVEIVDNDDDVYRRELGSFSFDWECTARAGDLYKRGSSETNSFTTSNANPTVDYVPRGAAPADGVSETISVTAYFEPIGSRRPRELIGKATLPVKFKKKFNIALLPASGQQLPAENTCGLSASLKETLPAGATVDWQWTHAGVGSLSAGPTDANPAESSALLDTGSTEGDATVTVQARVNVPASGTTPPLSVLTDPASTTLKIRKDLKTLTMAGGWTIEISVPAPGFSQASAYVVVPKISKARSYSVLLEKPTPDVDRGVPFPSTRTINPAAPGPTWEDRGGSYWSGLSGGGGADPWAYTNVVPWLRSRFSDMTVTVTVTLQ